MNAHAAAKQNILLRFLPLWSFLILIALCWEADPHGKRFIGGEVLWKVLYALFLAASLAVLSPRFERWMNARWPKWKAARHGDDWFWFDVIVCTYTFGPLMQLTIPAPRPPDSSLAHLYGFPSGHQFSSFALAWLVWHIHPRLALLWFGASLLVGWARIETHDHYAYQVLGGAALGALLGWWKSRSSEGLFLPRVWHWWQRRRLASE